tara:strand:+ start:885 stop:1736 length:852 start_codon:yes stop_codon:yes gene_type:complete
VNEITIGSALKLAELKLSAAGIQNPKLDSKILLCHVLAIAPGSLFADLGRKLNIGTSQKFEELVQRRLLREPVSHLIGQREFWSLSFEVSADVLDPRPASETLIQAAVDLMGKKEKGISALDLGTGSGCLIISLLTELPFARGVGVDISEPALIIARKNAEKNLVHNRIKFLKSFWGEDLSEIFEIILCNPPYISENERGSLEPEVCDHEPECALFAGNDGLSAFRQLAPNIYRLLKPEGFAVIECGKGQAQSVIEIFSNADLRHVETRLDLDGIERCCIFGR